VITITNAAELWHQSHGRSAWDSPQNGSALVGR